MARKATEEEKAYIKRYKALSGDTTPEGGPMTVRKGLFNHYVCRLCGKAIAYKDVDWELDKLTGYCRSCMAKLKRMEQSEKGETKKPNDFRVAGTSFRELEIESLGEENDDYTMSKREILDAGMEDEKVFRLEWRVLPGELVPEPDNPADPNAIAVYADGTQIGYIKKGDTKKVKELLEKGQTVISVYIYGGDYKIVEENEDGKYELTAGNLAYWADVHIAVQATE